MENLNGTEVHVMSNTAISRILDVHNIQYYIENGRLYADTMEGGTQPYERTEDLSGISKSDLYLWLGY